MELSLYETSKLLKGSQTYKQLGFSMLLTRLRNQYAQEETEANLKKCADEINTFLNKFVKIMVSDLDNIVKLIKTEGSHQVLTFDETCQLIESGKILHIAGAGELLKKLPQGNWIGGSTEYFMSVDGGLVTNKLFFVTEFQFEDFKIKTYNTQNIKNIANDAFENGFTVLIIPFDSNVHITYAENVTNYENIFMRTIVGWISGVNLNSIAEKPVSINGFLNEVYTDNAVAIHIKVNESQTVDLKIANIFEQKEDSPIIEFESSGFDIDKCLIDGKECNLADYIADNNLDIRLPLVGDYSGNGINISFKSIENSHVYFYAPVFKGIKYRIAKAVPDYATAFQAVMEKQSANHVVFSCNCILNFLYGNLLGKKIEGFTGPITFGEIAYQLVNQTLAYVTVRE